MKISRSQFINATLWLLVSVFIVLLDQLSKHWIRQHINVGQPLELLPFFNLILSFNQGSAFGFLNQAGGWQVIFFSVFSLAIIIILFIWLLRLKYPNSWTACALSLIIGGAAGNLIDRIRFSMVVDFFDFHIGDWHYATFNVADSAIVAGVLMILIQSFFRKNKVS